MESPRPRSDDPLRTPVQFLKGVGPRRAELLAKLDLRTAVDLLFFFPRDYEDLTHRRGLDELVEDELQTVRGVVEEIEFRSMRQGRCVLGVLFSAEGGLLRATWFNQPFLRDRFTRGQEMLVTGKPKKAPMAWEMVHPRVVSLEGESNEGPPEPILPVYPLTEGLRQHHIRNIVRRLLETHVEHLEETFPADYLAEHALAPVREAVAGIHFPKDREQLDVARRRFVYQELFILQLGLAVRRQRLNATRQAPPLEATAKIDARIRRLFPFDLTDAQQRVIGEIRDDLARTIPMNRLLQGDVGAGKTIVAVYGMLTAIAHRHQAVLMAPTEVLARQHLATLNRLLHESLAEEKVRIAGLFGGLPPSERTKQLERIAKGEVDLIVGTQAVIQEDVRFERLGLVVIDEQHKFGVKQRASLKASGLAPHYLVMTATPIPRSMTMTLFGDLDVSVLDETPPGRKPTRTYLAEDDARDRWWSFLRDKLREGRQAYVVVPLVDESETLDVVSLTSAYEELANGPLEEFRLGLLHGRMSSEEKDTVMNDFRSGEVQVLVSTTVIEVGVDIANATIMVIENAERFGLSQLHQLRGRIARGKHPGVCAVFYSAETEDARKRLEAFSKTNDGFELAEMDFQLRGPGEVLGTRQHGLPPFRIADLLRDAELLKEARGDAFQLVESDPGLKKTENERLRRMVLARYGDVLELGDVG